MSRLIFITGQPGVGKTTAILKVCEVLKTSGYTAGGMVTREVREGGARVGFKIVDIKSGREGWLAHVNQASGPKIGRYRVNLRDLDVVGSKSIREAISDAAVIVVDEIGPMELCSSTFIEAVNQAVESGKPFVGTIHFKARNKLLKFFKASHAEIFTLTLKDRDSVPKLVVDRTVENLRKN